MAPSPAVAPASLPDQIFRSLCAAILAGRFAAGEKLPTQRALAQQYGANMTTVREAVKKLEQLRLVDVRHGDAMRVLDWRRHGSIDILALLLFGETFDPVLLANVMEARRLLLTECARLAASRATPEQVAHLREAAAEIAEANDQAAVQELDFGFYELLAQASENLVFALIFNSIRDLYLENAEGFSAIVGDASELIPFYGTIAESVAEGRESAAAESASELALRQETRLLAAVEEATTGGASQR